MEVSDQSSNDKLDPPDGYRLVTFNVCGIKNIFSFHPWNRLKSFQGMFEYMHADILCFQELKLQSKDLTKAMTIVPGYVSYFTFPLVKKGYSGVAIYVRDSIGVLRAEEGITGRLCGPGQRVPYYLSEDQIGGYPEVAESDALTIDSEGRALVLDLGAFVLIGLYCPANSMGDQEEFRDLFFQLLDKRVRNLRTLGRLVVVLGDINVACQPQDSGPGLEILFKAKQLVHGINISSKDYEPDDKTIDIWKTETVPRSVINKWLEDPLVGLVDTTRKLFKDRQRMYTCWNQLVNARPANFGSRIDYIFTPPDFELTGGDLLLEYMGSDHCPVYSDLRIEGLSGTLKAPALHRKRAIAFEASVKNMFAQRQDLVLTSPAPYSVARSSGTEMTGKKQPLAKVVSIGIQKSPLKSVEGQKQITSFFKKKPLSVTSAAKSSTHAHSNETDALVNAYALTTDEKTQVDSEKVWKGIFTLKKPQCYHDEECILQLSKKPGPNKGKHFWSCKRPQGPENDKEFRCKFFKWA